MQKKKKKKSWSAVDDDDDEFCSVSMQGGGRMTDRLTVSQPLWQLRVTDSGQMASLMQGHERRKVKETDRGEVPARRLVAMLTPTPTHSLAERTPHMALSAQLLALT